MSQHTTDQKLTAGLAALAGVGAIAAGFLNWYKLSSGGESETFSGLESTAGMGTLGLGVVMLVCAAVLMFRGAASGGKASSVVLLIVALFALFASGYSATSPGDAVASFESSDVAETYGISDQEAEVLIKQAIEAGDLEVSAESGALLAVGPSLLGVIAGIMGIRRSKQIRGATSAGPAAALPAPAENPSV
ncbi:MAG: hypothetical protein ACLGHL_07300 [Actinomycetota bacterium]